MSPPPLSLPPAPASLPPVPRHSDSPRSARGNGPPPPMPSVPRYDREERGERFQGPGGPRPDFEDRGRWEGGPGGGGFDDRRRGPPGGGWDDRRGPPMMGGGGYGGGGGGGGYARRSRSPEWDDRRKRRRSMSPRREAYLSPGRSPRDFYNDGPPPRDSRPPYRDERSDYYRDAPYPDSRGPPPPQSAYAPRRPGMDPPDSLPYQVTFRYFTDWFRESQPGVTASPEVLDAAWEKYKRSGLRKSHFAAFEEHRRKMWFREKYEGGKEWEETRVALRKKGREGKMDKWVEEEKSGKYEGLSFDEESRAAKVSSPAKEKSDSNGTAPVASASAVAADADVDVKMETASEEPKPTLTTAMEVDEDKPKREPSEERGREEEVKPKRDNSEVGGGREEEASSREPVGRGTISRDTVVIDSSNTQLFIKTIPPDISRKDLEEHCKQVPGFDYLALSEPLPLKKYHRVGWVQFKTVEDMPKAIEVLCESKLGNFTLHMHQTLPAYGKLRITPAIANSSDRLAKDLEQIRKVALAFEKELGDARGSAVIEEKDALAREEMNKDSGEAVDEVNKRTLDQYLNYLRVVFNTCYYCVATFNFPEELGRRCPKHVRRLAGWDPRANLPTSNDIAWMKTLDDKAPLLINRDELDPRDFGGDSYDEELHRICHTHIKHEEEGKFRCKECTKLFSALKFIEKHLSTKHPETLGDTLDQLKFFNNFVLDPGHLPVSSSAPEGSRDNGPPPPRFDSNGSYPPPLSYGGPRGEFPRGEFPRGGDARRDSRTLSDRIGDRLEEPLIKRRREEAPRGPPPPPPEGAVLDPRARKGASSYADLDTAPSGADVMLPY